MNFAAIRIKCIEIVGWKKQPIGWYRLGDTEHREYKDNLPNYPESSAAALQLVEWMADKMGKHVELTRTPNLRWIICVTNNGPVLHFAADTFSLAVCLAFLKANNIEPETLQ